MKTEELILLEQVCSHYQVEVCFVNSLSDFGLIEIMPIEQAYYIHTDEISNLEKMIRMHHDLQVNMEGIDVAFNLLQKIDALQIELNMLRNRLRLYESGD